MRFSSLKLSKDSLRTGPKINKFYVKVQYQPIVVYVIILRMDDDTTS